MIALTNFETAMRKLPLVAILRGLPPADAVAVGTALFDAGFRLIEVPLNSPQPLLSIETLSRQLPDAMVGAGTVTEAEQVRQVQSAGGQLIVSPHFDRQLVEATVKRGLISMPGVMTPSEAFAGLRLGAHALKLFPAEAVSAPALKAMRAVLPPHVRLLPVGGISPQHFAPYRAAGASGFGLGSALYRPGDSAAEVARNAQNFVAAWQDVCN